MKVDWVMLGVPNVPLPSPFPQPRAIRLHDSSSPPSGSCAAHSDYSGPAGLQVPHAQWQPAPLRSASEGPVSACALPLCVCRGRWAGPQGQGSASDAPPSRHPRD